MLVLGPQVTDFNFFYRYRRPGLASSHTYRPPYFNYHVS
jgi:hypothetical protein